jgi:hypothetical protein
VRVMEVKMMRVRVFSSSTILRQSRRLVQWGYTSLLLLAVLEILQIIIVIIIRVWCYISLQDLLISFKFYVVRTVHFGMKL